MQELTNAFLICGTAQDASATKLADLSDRLKMRSGFSKFHLNRLWVLHRNTAPSWGRRLGILRTKFGFYTNPVIEDKVYKWAHAVNTQVCEEETEQWWRAVEDKSTPLTYRTHKAEIAMEPLYDNSGGSALLFGARAGGLRTLAYRRRFDTSTDMARLICQICGTEEKTTEHIVLHCADLGPSQLEGTTFTLALGFRGDMKKSTAVARAVPITKQIGAVVAQSAQTVPTRRQC
ncbi:hypothetical protein HPB51_021699 [Rhipicephalus microplus]|uniref:Tick transposon n=1 Tax=Rhipicephalus microplus TaxID=6941 RepID=A0A9J6D775_RHIMP|nr:hypothetical protein HPB51_021699 [Rhipicephalus microplus]